MTDLPTRLRNNHRLKGAIVYPLMDEAAAEIERLTALLETIKAAHSIGFGAGTVTLSYWNNGQARDAHAVLYPIVFPETKEPRNDQ